MVKAGEGQRSTAEGRPDFQVVVEMTVETQVILEQQEEVVAGVEELVQGALDQEVDAFARVRVRAGVHKDIDRQVGPIGAGEVQQSGMAIGFTGWAAEHPGSDAREVSGAAPVFWNPGQLPLEPAASTVPASAQCLQIGQAFGFELETG
jgi:hypothetical protein